MKIFSLFKRKNPMDLMNKQIQKYCEDIERCHAGWRFWPANATEEQKMAAIELYIQTGEHRWFPPGTVDVPYVIESNNEHRRNERS